MNSLVLSSIVSWFNRAVIFGTVVMYGALGETLTEKSGNMNLGIPGVMCIGGAFGFAGAYAYELACGGQPNAVLLILIALLCAFGASALSGLLFSFLTTTLRANQNVTGLALTIFGSGLSKFFGMYIIPEGTTTVKAIAANAIFSKRLPFAGKLGTVGELLFNYGFMMYLAIALCILATIFLNRTKTGLNLRAVGENPATADASGVNVTRYKYLSTVIGSGVAGLGGVYFILDYNYGGWSTFGAQSIEALGWLAVALVIFSTWRPINLIWGSYLFGFFYWLYNFISVFGVRVNSAQSSLLEAIPYVITILVLVLGSIFGKMDRQAPASLGTNYFREER